MPYVVVRWGSIVVDSSVKPSHVVFKFPIMRARGSGSG